MGPNTKQFLVSVAGVTLGVIIGNVISHFALHMAHSKLGHASAAHSQPAAQGVPATATAAPAQ